MSTALALAPSPSTFAARLASILPDAISPWVIALAIMSTGANVLLHPGTWPTSDLDSHVATIDLYRRSLLDGVVWPYDRSAAFGHDGTPYYGWWCELALGALAVLAGLLGSTAPAMLVAKVVTVLALGALPLATAWCARQLCPSAGERGELVSHAGALSGAAFLACANTDLYSGVGVSVASTMGMLNQTIGLVLLTLVAGCAARLARLERRGLDLRLALSVAAVLMCHMQSALAAAVVLVPALLRHPRAVLLSGGAGVLLAAGSLSALLTLSDRLLPLFLWHHTPGPDPLFAVVAPLLEATFSTLCLPGVLVSLLLLAMACRALRTTSPTRDLVIAALLLCACATLPSFRMLMPAGSQPYRFASLGLLLLLVAGAAPLGLAWMRWTADFRFATRYAAVATVWLGLMVGVACQWPDEEPGDTPAAAAAELALGTPASPVPPGSRILASDQISWHRWAVDVLKQEAGWTTLNAAHGPSAPPTLAASISAAASLGCAPMYPRWEAAMTPADGLAVLRDLGVTHIVQLFDPAALKAPKPISPVPGLARAASTSHARAWRLADPAPVLEPAPQLVGLDLGRERALRIFAAGWWAHVRARDHLTARLVMASGGDRAVQGEISAAAAATPSSKVVAVDFSDIPPARTADVVLTGDTTVDRAKAFVEHMTAAEAMLRALAPTNPSPAAAPALTASWSADGRSALLGGLEPGHPYLWRTSYSPGFSVDGGRVLEEASGLTVVIPDRSSVVVRFSRISAVVVVGTLMSFLTAIGLGLVVVRRGREVFPEG